MNPSRTYRPDLDGLRGLAVSAVLLYHVRLGCPGGFIGVDVFFVISGYLISSHILEEIERGTFSLSTFWERRIRRISPAAAATVFAVLGAAWLVFLPTDFASVARSVAAHAVLASNVFFNAQPSGYFDAGMETQPLLHTWSLAIEEQFYLLFPPMLLFLSRFGPSRRNLAVALIASASFALSVAGAHAHTSSSFYLLPSRAWELMVGALLAMAPDRRPRQSTRSWPAEVAGGLGLILIALPLALYRNGMAFPGLAALPPCAGAALLIASSRERPSLAGKLLGFRPLVFVGLISYSLYLWHWPVLSFSTYLCGDVIWPYRLALLGVSGLVATISWRFVESPFRKRRLCSRPSKLFAFGGLVMASQLALGLLVMRWDGLPSRFSSEALAYVDGAKRFPMQKTTSDEQALAVQFTELGARDADLPVSVMIWGDSHAVAITPALEELCNQRRQRCLLASRLGVAPVLDGGDFAKEVLAFADSRHVGAIVLAANWRFYARRPGFGDQFTATVRAALATGARVFIFKSIPQQTVNVPRIAAILSRYGGDPAGIGVTRDDHRARSVPMDQPFTDASRLGATVVDPAACLIDQNDRYAGVKGERALYIDDNHLSIDGALLLVPLLGPLFP